MKAKLWLAVGIGAVIVAVVLAVNYAVNSSIARGEQAARSVADALDAIVHARPRVTVNTRVIVEQTKPISELATASKVLHVRYEYRNERYGSTKAMTLSGQFRAKAGFDLKRVFSLSVNTTASTVTVHVPKPSILACEMISQTVEASDNGWWNSLTVQDHADAIDEMTLKANEEAKASTLLADAKSEFETSVKQIPALKEMTVSFEYETPPDR